MLCGQHERASIGTDPLLLELEFWFPWILVFVGTALNILSFAVFSRARLRATTTSILLRMLAVTDSLSLMVGILTKVDSVSETFGKTRFGCRVSEFISEVFTSLSGWTLVMITMERVICVFRPLDVQNIITRTRILQVVIGFIALLLLICIPHLFIVSLKCENGCCMCWVFNDEFSSEYIFPIKQGVHTMLCGTPFVVMFVSNIMIIWRLISQNRKRRSLGVSEGSKSTHSMTILLLTISFAYLLFVLPNNINDYVYSKMTALLSEEEMRRMHIVVTLGQILGWLNHSCNFILYTISGQRFRNEALTMLTCGRYMPNWNEEARVHHDTTWSLYQRVMTGWLAWRRRGIQRLLVFIYRPKPINDLYELSLDLIMVKKYINIIDEAIKSKPNITISHGTLLFESLQKLLFHVRSSNVLLNE